MSGGRPSDYTQELADEICARLSEGQSMRTVCAADDMPAAGTVFRWLRTNEEFCKQYARAKAESADALVEEMTDISDDGTNDWMRRLNSDGEPVGWVVNGEHIQRSRLRVETRKWIAAKLKPKKYGDKLDATVSSPDGGPLVVFLDSRDREA